MSVNESSSSPYISNNVPISPGSLVEIGRVKVARVEEVNYNSFTESCLNLCSHDKAIAKKVFIEIFFKSCGHLWDRGSNTTSNAGDTKRRIKIEGE